MKKTSFLLALALCGIVSLAGNSFAGDCKTCIIPIPKTHPRPCKTKVCTEIVDRCTKTCKAKGPCGKIYSYSVTEITYKDVYSDGTSRVWKSSI